MKLYLENFKCFENAEFDFSDEKFQLINAESGFGKSSIFEAIKFAFWGNKSTDIITFNKKKCKVIVEWKGLRIIRTKNPNNICIQKLDSDEKIKNPEEYIEKYIPQYFFNFMNLKEDVQKKVIDKILNHESVENLSTNLKKLIKEGNNILKENEIKLNTYEESLKNLPYIRNIEKPIDISDILNIELMEKKVLAAQEIIISLNKSIGIYENLFTKLKEYSNISIDSQIKVEDDINILEKKKNNIIETNKELFLIEKEIKKCNLNINNLNKKIEEIENISKNIQSNSFKDSLTSEYVNFYRDNVQKNLNTKKEIDDILKKCKKYKGGNNIEKINKCIEDSEKNKDIFEYKCPSCKCSLFFSELEKSLKISTINPDIGKLNEILRLTKLIDENFNKHTLDNLELVVNNKIKYINQKLNEEERLESFKKSLKKIEQKKLDSLEEVNINLSCLKKSFEKIIKKKNIQKELDKYNIDDLKKNLSEKVEEKEKLEIKIKESIVKSKELSLWEQNEYLKEAKKNFLEKINFHKSNINNISSVLQKMEKIKNIVQESYMLSIQSFVNEFNELLIFFTEHFFNNKDISVQADIIKENLTGKNAKFQLDFKIFHNGILTKSNTLSSGEAARINLAIDLSIYKLQNSSAPLLLDEVTSNLDSDISTKILKKVNSCIDNNIFVIAHQVTEGIFDNIFNEDFLNKHSKFAR